MTDPIIDINHGITTDLLFPGLGIAAAGGFLCTQNVILGIILIVPGIIILLSVKGVLIDTKRKRAKPYFNAFFFKAGEWESLEVYDKIELALNYESQTMNMGIAMSQTYQTKSYTIYLSSEEGNRIDLKEILDYKEAKDFLLKYASTLTLVAKDNVELTRQALSKRKHRH